MSTMFSSKSRKAIAAIALIATTGLSAAACGSSDDSSSSSSSSETKAAAPKPVAAIDSLKGNDTQVTLDQGFVDAITSLGLTPGVLGTATLTDGVLAFPITGGNVDYYDPNESYRPYVQGSISHDGSGISLSTADIEVDLTDFRIDPGTSQLFGTVTANGEKVADDVYIFNLDGSTLKPLAMDADGNAVLEGTTVLISPDAAKLLNDTFGTDAVTDQLVVGIAKITAKAAS